MQYQSLAAVAMQLQSYHLMFVDVSTIRKFQASLLIITCSRCTNSNYADASVTVQPVQ